MREKIYTIPVHDAYATASGCPLCRLEETRTDELVAYYLGPALMEPEVRTLTNARGFCRDHWRALYNCGENRLGLGLLLHTHVAELTDELRRLQPGTTYAARKGLFASGRKEDRVKILETAERIEQKVESCVICDRLDQTMGHYLDVICAEYFAEPEFRQQFNQSHGHCLPHLALLLRSAVHFLSPNQALELVTQVMSQEQEAMAALRDDIEWFTLKFDYRNARADWKNSRDALPRAIRQISGHTDLKST
jgi:hypothetical protein